jgi:hypothetical protein
VAYNHKMAARRIDGPIEPMTLGNMRANDLVDSDFDPSKPQGAVLPLLAPW